MAELHEIQAEITRLSPDDREALLVWLLAADRKVWNEEISITAVDELFPGMIPCLARYSTRNGNRP